MTRGMYSVPNPTSGIDPKLTENFLLTQPDVLDASVWMRDDRLVAHVTLPDETTWTPKKLQSACAFELGLHQTPRDFFIVQARLKGDYKANLKVA